MSNLCGLGVVGTEVLDLSSECCIIFLAQGPIDKVSVLHTLNEQEFILGGNGGVVLSNWTSVKGTGVDHATMAVSGKEFRESGMEVIRDKGGDYVFFTIGNDKKVTGPDSVEIVLPSRTWVNSWLGAIRAGSLSLYISFHCFSFQRVSFGLLV